MRIENIVSLILRINVIVSIIIMIIGYLTGSNLLWIGTLLLIITPLLRTFSALIIFLYEKEILFFFSALYVLIIFIISALMI
ncbi:MAG: hypothetical protein DSO09_06125 [Candidatus Methanomethylicota archaeon]|jgi:uncharacterized membrane protein|uniref:DUF1634 domain-containing protein n=1 Tax=Thermoproteota archaeon TaxID=2056631 RepID=A0A520KEQ5_9CREN|nr:MAG: DUF1634 domain-containing protein [Candidatus Verstraetearchaeota archaeon]TDA37834.1 MAG: hypothetical protein DSO09_06125 [Candidatus Verstraetearchaeota archaeon]